MGPHSRDSPIRRMASRWLPATVPVWRHICEGDRWWPAQVVAENVKATGRLDIGERKHVLRDRSGQISRRMAFHSLRNHAGQVL